MFSQELQLGRDSHLGEALPIRRVPIFDKLPRRALRPRAGTTPTFATIRADFLVARKSLRCYHLGQSLAVRIHPHFNQHRRRTHNE